MKEKQINVITKIYNNLYCIKEIESVNIYVIIGKDRLLVVDTGYGYHDLKDDIAKISDKPYVVVLTHGHPDHGLGSFRFKEVYLNHKDLPYLLSSDNRKMKESVVEYRLEKMPELKGKLGSDEYYASNIDNVAFLDIKEGDIFDLGDLKFEVIVVPGHSYGSIALLERKMKWLFTGDVISNYNIWNHSKFPEETPPLDVLLDTYRKMDKRKDEFDEIFPAHGERPIDKTVIKDLEEMILDLLHNYQNDEVIHTFIGDAYRHVYKGHAFLYSKELLQDALKREIK